jgi:predicted flap endonuclease-1-like 5' DNA nuclease
MPTVTTGEGFGEGIEPMEPAKKAVLDTTSAPPQPGDTTDIEAAHPEIVDNIVNDRDSDTEASAVAPKETVRPKSAAAKASGGKSDDLTVLHGVGPKMQAALRSGGLDSYTKIAAASDEELRAAIEQAGMRLAPNLDTWREQAIFLARGDREGFEAMKNALRGQTVESDEDSDAQEKDNFTDTGRR